MVNDLNSFLAANRKQDPNRPADLRSAIAKTNELQDNQGVLPYITNALNSFSRGMTQFVETPYNLMNNAPRLMNLLHGEQNVGKISEMAATAEPNMINNAIKAVFPSEDPLIDLVAEHYPGMGGVGGIKTPNPNYPTTSNIMEGFGTGVATLGAGTLAAGTPGIAGKIGQYVSAPAVAAPKTAVAAELAASAGGETGRYVAEKNEWGPVASFMAQMLGSMGPAALTYSAPNAIGKVFSKGVEPTGELTGVGRLLSKIGVPEDKLLNVNVKGQYPFQQTVDKGDEALAAMERQGIRPSVGLTGNRAGAQMESGASAIPFFSSVPENVRTQQFDQFTSALTGAAGKVRPAGSGPMVDPSMMQQQVYDIAEGGAKRMQGSFGGREDALMTKIGARTPIDVTATRQAIAEMLPKVDPEMQGALQHELDLLDQMIVKAKGTTMQPQVSSILDDAGNPITKMSPVETAVDTNTVPYEQFRSWRTNVGRRTDQPSIKGGQAKQLYAAITQDLTGAAEKAGVADEFKALMSDQAAAHADDVLLSQGGDLPQAAKLTGGQLERSGQFLRQAYANPDKMDYIRRNATPEQWANLRANIVQDLGLAKAGAQDATGDVISPNKFITEWNKMDPRVKNMLFDDDLGTRQTLDDLALIADAFKTRGLEANTSRTAGTGLGAMEIKQGAKGAALLATGAAGATNLPATLAGLGLTYGAVKGLMSETLARWAAGQTPTVQSTMGARLPGAAARSLSNADDGDQEYR